MIVKMGEFFILGTLGHTIILWENVEKCDGNGTWSVLMCVRENDELNAKHVCLCAWN